MNNNGHRLAILRGILAVMVILFSVMTLLFSHSHITTLHESRVDPLESMMGMKKMGAKTTTQVWKQPKNEGQRPARNKEGAAATTNKATPSLQTKSKLTNTKMVEEVDSVMVKKDDKPAEAENEKEEYETPPSSDSKDQDETEPDKKFEKEDQDKHNDLLTPSDTTATRQSNTTKFVRYNNVAIVTKIHGLHNWQTLEQGLCLFHYAYNHKVLYDIIIFTAEPIPNEDIERLQKMIAPSKFSVVMDNRGLQEEIAALPHAKYQFLLNYCNITSTDHLTWFSECGEGKIKYRLAYNWQAEFRSLHIWHHPALKDYRYMFWLDTDAFCTKPIEKDPVEYFIQNEGVIMFEHFPQAYSNMKIQRKVAEGFNHTICELKVSEEGNFVVKLGSPRHCHKRGIPNIHGFLHITDMDFFRSPQVMQSLEGMFGDCFLCRTPDDQLAVTAPTAIYAPERSFDMRSKGFHLDIFHNTYLDGWERAMPAGFKKYWSEKAKFTLPSADGICPIVAKN